jgi:hypothetical protein
MLLILTMDGRYSSFGRSGLNMKATWTGTNETTNETKKWENFEYDGFDRLDAAIARREQQRNLDEALKHRTWSGYERKVKQVGKKDEIDKEWDKKLYEHRDEIRQFYARSSRARASERCLSEYRRLEGGHNHELPEPNKDYCSCCRKPFVHGYQNVIKIDTTPTQVLGWEGQDLGLEGHTESEGLLSRRMCAASLSRDGRCGVPLLWRVL